MRRYTLFKREEQLNLDGLRCFLWLSGLKHARLEGGFPLQRGTQVQTLLESTFSLSFSNVQDGRHDLQFKNKRNLFKHACTKHV